MSKIFFNYIVSDFGIKAGEPTSASFFHSHVIASRQGLGFEEDNVADFLDKTHQELESSWKEVEAYHSKFVDIFSDRLNKIHALNYTKEFWKRIFSIGLLRNISNVHMFFSLAERHFNPETHSCKILSKDNYVFCYDFEEQRSLLTSSWVGQEQLLSMYVECFYPKYYSKIKADGDIINIPVGSTQNKSYKLWSNYLFISSFVGKFKISNLTRVVNVLLTRLRKRLIRHRTIVGLIGVCFSRNHLMEVCNQSEGAVQPISLASSDGSSKVDLANRIKLFSLQDNASRFERFFFFVSVYLFPRILLEDFTTVIGGCRLQLSRYPRLKYIVSESWLSSSLTNIFRSLAFELRSVATYYNEHNCIFHPFQDEFVHFQSELVDKYLTFGWNSPNAKMIPLASLFPFSIPRQSIKYDILYVSYPMEQYRSIYSASYASSGYGAISHLAFAKNFFRALPHELKQAISYRGYPKDYALMGIFYNKEEMLENYLKGVAFVSSFKAKGETCKQQMAASRIVVIDSLSTAYLESLMMNIPTLCFWNRDAMFLKESSIGFYDDLIEAKIVHVSPEDAAKHLNCVYSDPSLWWDNPLTQSLRTRWLSRNFGNPLLMKEYLLKLAIGS